jgi:nicotinate-nucleotide pyrophosphorylase (carboxylating)
VDGPSESASAISSRPVRAVVKQAQPIDACAPPSTESARQSGIETVSNSRHLQAGRGALDPAAYPTVFATGEIDAALAYELRRRSRRKRQPAMSIRRLNGAGKVRCQSSTKPAIVGALMKVLPDPPRKSQHDPIAIALAEDLGPGDLTSRYFVGNERGRARIFARENAIAAGVETAAEVFGRVDPQTRVKIVEPSGNRLKSGATVLEISGVVRSILTAERVALNFLQRLSGVATLTAQFVKAAGRHKVRVLDTRKTTPGLRALEKAAVVAGGGANHRFGLYDMVMVKDNHLLAAQRLDELQKAITHFRAEHPGLRVELEADTLAQVRSFLTLRGVDVILLDNMPPKTIAAAVRLGKGRVEFEASGGVTLKTVGAIAATGVDFISVGALTHSARAIDFSLELLP